MIATVDLSNRAINETQINRSISKMVGSEFSYLSRTCYYPKLIKYKEDISRLTQITDNDIKEFRDSLSPQYRSFSILNEKYTVMLLLAQLHFAQKKRITVSELFFYMMAIKFYSSVLHKGLPKFCSDDIWNRSLETISPKHLFKSRNGIPNAIDYLTKIIFKKYKPMITKNKIDEHTVFRMVYELRHRLSQSTKSFAGVYYKIAEDVQKKKLKDEKGQEEITDLQLASDKISMSICTFGQIDEASLKLAILKSGIKRELGYLIVSELSTVEYKQQLRFITMLTCRLAKNLNTFCQEQSRNNVVRKVVNGARFGNYTIKDQIISLVNSLESSYRFKSINKNQLVIFFSHYLTLFIRSKTC